MILKVLILSCVFFSLGVVEKIEEPELVYNERFLNLGPSTIHSIKGKFYEEKQKKLPPSHLGSNKIVEITNPEINTETHTNQVPVNVMKQLNQHELDSYHQQKPIEQQNNFNMMVPTLEINNRDILSLFKMLNDSPKKSDQPPMNTSNSILHIKNKKRTHENQINGDNNNTNSSEPLRLQLHTQKVTSDIKTNGTIETMKKEIAFDSLLIKNNFSYVTTPESPKNIISSYMKNKINPEANIFSNEITPMTDARRLAINPHYQPMQPAFFQMPLTTDNYNIRAITPMFERNKYGNNLINNLYTNREFPLKENKLIEKGTCEDKENDEDLERSGDDIEIKDPIKGSGISDVVKNRMMLMNHPRVCYACNSINDPSCWLPGRSTAVKYCRADHPSCLTKLYKFKGLSYTIRDCGNICEQSAEGPKYSYCTICHHDLCNGGFNLKIQNITILMFIIFNLQIIKTFF